MACIEAAKAGDLEKLKELALIEGALLVTDEDGRSVYHWAVINRHGEIIDWLNEEKKIDIDVRDKVGRTPFFECCFLKYWPLASVLLDFGANPNCYANGTAPVLLASSFFQVDLINQMLEIKDESGAQKLDLTVCVADGANALHFAAMSEYSPHPARNLKLAELLYDHGAPDVIDDFGRSAANLLGSHDYYFESEFIKCTADHPH